MFLYWEGFEIDGSDTDFSIVLPENIQILEFVECFLSIPIFDKKQKPEFHYYNGDKNKELTYEDFQQKVRSGEYTYFNISRSCCHIEELHEELKKEIYSISKRREPHEAAFGKVENPCTAPIKENDCEGVTLYIGKEQYIKMEEEPLGYVTNTTLLSGISTPLSCVNINVGPSFYYEYAMYIMDYMIDKFPSVATFGGLDCAGGWTDGCTYASSIYGYEKITIPVVHSVKNTLKHLCEYDILCPAIQYYKSGWKQERTKDFYMVNGMPSFVKSKKKLRSMSLGQYADFAESVLSSDRNEFEMICDTAVSIIFPKPDDFAENPKAQKKLAQAFDLLPEENWFWMGYFCVSMENGQRTAQFRIHYQLKPYFQCLISLREEGEIEGIKQITYRRRHEE